MEQELRQSSFKAVQELNALETSLKQSFNKNDEGETLSKGLMELPEKLTNLGQQLAEVDNQKDQQEANLKFMFQSLKSDFMKDLSATASEAKAELDTEYQNAKGELIEIKKAHAFLKVRLDSGHKLFDAVRSRLSYLGRTYQ